MAYKNLQPLLEFETGANPEASIILLHGLGANSRLFEPVARRLAASTRGAVRFVLPQAPIQPVLWVGGRQVSAWFDLRSSDFSQQEDEVGLRSGQQYCDVLIRRELERGIPSERVLIGGFSQGCALSLMAGIRFPERLGGIFGMSGYLPLITTTESEQRQINRDTPVFLAHGEQDRIILPDLAVKARDVLRNQGHEVSWHTYPIDHSICESELTDLEGWMTRILEV